MVINVNRIIKTNYYMVVRAVQPTNSIHTILIRTLVKSLRNLCLAWDPG